MTNLAVDVNFVVCNYPSSVYIGLVVGFVILTIGVSGVSSCFVRYRLLYFIYCMVLAVFVVAIGFVCLVLVVLAVLCRFCYALHT
jgi:hypothetical protein